MILFFGNRFVLNFSFSFSVIVVVARGLSSVRIIFLTFSAFSLLMVVVVSARRVFCNVMILSTLSLRIISIIVCSAFFSSLIKLVNVLAGCFSVA